MSGTTNVGSKLNGNRQSAAIVSEDLYKEVKQSVTIEDFVRVKLPGTSGRWSLYEISGLAPSAAAALSAEVEEPGETRQRYAGLDWVRVLDEAELPIGKVAREDCCEQDVNGL